jgi:indolepyruvate ferredoxin oxidoreductase alpha subunit
MSKLSENLVNPDPWSAMIMGDYALARAMIEAGVRVITTFPGSPTPEIAAALTNEKVALEVATGAAVNGHLSCVFFKSVGLNVASDSMVQLPLLELIGGMVIVLGDDPGLNSSQNEQDNRHFSRMSYMPMFEPATPQEARDMFLEAARLARENTCPVCLRLTTHVCHAREVVQFGPADLGQYDWRPRFDVENGPYIPITADVVPMKRAALEKLERFGGLSDESRFNTVYSPNGSGAPESRRGVVSASIPAIAVCENLRESGAAVDLLKLGLTYPLPRAKILEFLGAHDEVLVVEELDRVMEHEIKALAFDSGSSCRISARTDMADLQGELDPSRTWKLLSEAWPDLFEPRPPHQPTREVVPRLPQLCPGCGHRSAFHAIKQAIADDTITVADIGCHTMGYWPPYELGQLMLCMGASTGAGAGMSIGNKTRKVIAFMGDSTFFHAGMPALVNSMIYDHDLTLVLMENGTTAMTGHQPRAGSGEVGDKIDLVQMFRALGVSHVADVDAYDQAQLAGHIEDAMAHEGFSVVIARHPCMLKFTREQRKKMPGFRLPQVQVDQDKCDQSHVCVAEFGCPSFVRHEDGAVTVHEELCIGDGSCLKTCPVDALWRPKPGG